MIGIQLTEKGFNLPVKVTPKGGKNGFIPFAAGDEWIRIKVKEPPEDGKANAAVVELLAETLSLPKRNIAIIRGESSRIKHIAIQCADTRMVLGNLAIAMGVNPEDCFC